MVPLSAQHWQASLALLPGGLNLSRTEKRQNIKLPWALNFFGLVYYLSSVSSSLSFCLFCLCQCVSRLLASARSLLKQWSGSFLFNVFNTSPIFPLDLNLKQILLWWTCTLYIDIIYFVGSQTYSTQVGNWSVKRSWIKILQIFSFY